MKRDEVGTELPKYVFLPKPDQESLGCFWLRMSIFAALVADATGFSWHEVDDGLITIYWKSMSVSPSRRDLRELINTQLWSVPWDQVVHQLPLQLDDQDNRSLLVQFDESEFVIEVTRLGRECFFKMDPEFRYDDSFRLSCAAPGLDDQGREASWLLEDDRLVKYHVEPKKWRWFWQKADR